MESGEDVTCSRRAPASEAAGRPERPPGSGIRLVPAVIAGGAVLAIAGAITMVGSVELTRRQSVVADVGLVDVTVVFTRPGPAMIAAAVLTAVAFALLVTVLDLWAARRVTAPAHRPAEHQRRPLRSEATRSRPSGPLSVVALIPARNEAAHLPQTIRSLRDQTVPPSAIWVIADNCTDDTAAVARAAGAEVYETVENRHRKAGGLNQLLARLLPTRGPEHLVLVMDADTVMVGDFLEQAVQEFVAHPDLDAVGGVFYGDDRPGLLGQLQRNEYLRYGRDISRRQGRVFVLTGTASVFRADALAAVAAARGTVLPGIAGNVYDTYSLTEDNELTIALKSLGARMVSPKGCRVRTELMPTWPDLWNQRQRWQRGALENIGMYGLTSATARYWVQQLGLGYGVVALFAFLVLTVLSILFVGALVIVGFWALIGMVFVLERTATVWKGGWKARLLAAPLLIELAYSVFLQLVYVKSLADIALGRSKGWNAATVAPVAAR